MATTFADLKKNRKSSFESLTKKIEQISSPTRESFGDDRFWNPTIDKSGNGYAIIRFLPTLAGEDYPWVSYFDHGFQGPSGLWYIENDLTSIGKEDPCSEYNSILWNSGLEVNKEQVRKQKRRLHYVSNIYVVSDAANPDNEGKVVLYKYGKKIFQKLNEVMNTQFEDETPINPFDFWEGADFKLKIRNVEGYRNYDKSEFAEPAPLFGDDKKLEEVFNKQHSLKAFLEPSNFKSYEELETKLKKVLQLENDNTPKQKADAPEPTQTRRSVDEDQVKSQPKKPSSTDDDDVDTDYFKRLTED